MATPSLIDTLFQRTLDDLIKSLRHHPHHDSPSTLISKSIEEIKREIKSTDPTTKSTALQKLSYLNSLHFHDISWASFHAVECISSREFAHKKIGYLAISQSFSDSTPVILLITNQLRKDLKSNNEFEVSLALDCLSRVGNVDLCRDLTPEVFTLMSSSKVFVRKKAVGVVLRVFERYPDAVKVCFKRVVENLECRDPQVVSAVVGVFCELAAKEPISYLPLAPEFYRVLVDSRNNWVLIKVLKIFAKLAPLEPRLAKRIVEPICDLMRRTGAKSLLFECVRTVVTSLAEYESAVKLAVERIREFLVDDDPNLKYLGLHALTIVSSKHLWAVVENKDVVIKSLSDADPNIKIECLCLVMALVSEGNVLEICRVLVNYALKADPDFCNEIVGSILSTCSKNVYEIVVDFDWYVALLGEMSRIPNFHRGEEIEKQLIDIGMRVRDARLELVRLSRDLLIDPALLGNPFLHRVLYAAAWVCGEYVEFCRNLMELMEALLQPRTSLLPSSVRAVYLHSAFKVLIFSLHLYIFEDENVADEAASEVPDLASRNGCPESSLTRDKSYAPYEREVEASYLTDSKPDEDIPNVNGRNGETSTSYLEERNFTHESIINMLKFVEFSLCPLCVSCDVEIQERVRNVLGFVELVKQEITESLVPKVGTSERRELKASIFINWVHDAFTEELGPVSVMAQERVPVPGGLVLKQDLSDLLDICGNVGLQSTSVSVCDFYDEEYAGNSLSNLQSKDESEPSTESTSLLEEHRKRHGLYYLPSEKNEIVGNDYPPANDPNTDITINDDAHDLVKLTDNSLNSKRKPNHMKPRPVVVKLDEGDSSLYVAKKQESTDDLLSTAVRDILFSQEVVSTSVQHRESDKSLSKNKGKEKSEIDPLQSKEKASAGQIPDIGNSSSRRHKHRSHGNDRRKSSPKKKNSDGGNVGEKEMKKSRHRHGRHKASQDAGRAVSAVAQSSVIPDLLL